MICRFRKSDDERKDATPKAFDQVRFGLKKNWRRSITPELVTLRKDEDCAASGAYVRLAQLGEHMPYKHGVGGSSPSPGTINAGVVFNG